jgi:HSP20 family protein
MNDLVVQKNGETTGLAAGRNSVTYTPRFDAWETETEYVLAGDLPGVTAEDVELNYENHELAIYGRVAPRDGQGQPLVQEYGVGDFYRTFTLAETIDESAISAEVKDGVLTVHLPKRAEVRPRKIEVKSA